MSPTKVNNNSNSNNNNNNNNNNNSNNSNNNSNRCSSDASKQIPLWCKITFGLAAPPLQMTGNIIGFFFTLFLLEVVHLSPAQVSAIMLAGRVWDAITDPIVGQLLSMSSCSSRFKSRTRIWLLVASPAGAMAFCALWQFVPFCANAGGVGCFCYYLIMYLLYCTFITCYHVPYTASTMLISSHSSDKDEATAARIGCELIATVIGCGLFGFVISRKRIAIDCNTDINIGNGSYVIDSAAVEEERFAYRMGSIAISGIFLLCGSIGILCIRERVKHERSAQSYSLLVNVRAVLRFRPYLMLMAAFLFMSLAIQTVQANLALYTTHSIHLGSHTQTGILTVLCVAVFAVPMWHFLAIRFGKRVIFIVGLLPLGPCLIFATFMPPYNLAAYYATASMAGLSISVAMLMPWSMLPDVIDSYYLQYGERKEATFYSLYVFFTKFAAGISLAASTLALTAGSYDSASCTQPATVGIALRILIGPAPVVCILLSLFFIRLYPIGKEVRNQMDVDLRLKSEGLHSDTKINGLSDSDLLNKCEQCSSEASSDSSSSVEMAILAKEKEETRRRSGEEGKAGETKRLEVMDKDNSSLDSSSSATLLNVSSSAALLP